MSTSEFAVTFKEVGRSVIATRRPWRQFLDPSALSLPSSLSDATARVSQNLTRFLSNYCLVLLILIFLGLIYHPFSIIVFLLVFVAWFFLYFSRDDPLGVFGFVLDDLVLVIVLGLATGFALAFTGVFLNVLISLAIGAVVVCFHAALRSVEDVLGDLQDPFGDALLESPRGTMWSSLADPSMRFPLVNIMEMLKVIAVWRGSLVLWISIAFSLKDEKLYSFIAPKDGDLSFCWAMKLRTLLFQVPSPSFFCTVISFPLDPPLFGLSCKFQTVKLRNNFGRYYPVVCYR